MQAADDTLAPPPIAPGEAVGNRYTQAAQAYALRVLAGEIPACKWTRLAVERQLGDLQRAPGEAWPWVFDLERAANRLIQDLRAGCFGPISLETPADHDFRPYGSGHPRELLNVLSE